MQEPPARALQHIVRLSATALIGFLLIYAVLLGVHVRFPYLQSGADLVTQYKHDLSHNGRPFRSRGTLKIMAIGDSRVMSGFIPALFDREIVARGGPAVESYNFGLPGDAKFVDDLELMAERGMAPDIALLILPWDAVERDRPSFFRFLTYDAATMDRLFPFRTLPRDFAIAIAESHGSVSSLRRAYRVAEENIKRVESDRGYFFIERQSHYPNDELPADFSAQTDTPLVPERRIVPTGPVFDRLVRLCAAHKFTILFVPGYYRAGKFAPADSISAETVKTLAGQPDMGVVGPDYFLYPNRLFSDITHTNRRGAESYTRDLAKLVARRLTQPSPNE